MTGFGGRQMYGDDLLGMDVVSDFCRQQVCIYQQ